MFLDASCGHIRTAVVYSQWYSNCALRVRVPVVEHGSNVTLIVVSQTSLNQGWGENSNTLHKWTAMNSILLKWDVGRLPMLRLSSMKQSVQLIISVWTCSSPSSNVSLTQWSFLKSLKYLFFSKKSFLGGIRVSTLSIKSTSIITPLISSFNVKSCKINVFWH